MNGKILVTGASGLVGANLTRALLEQGCDVRAVAHKDQRALAGLAVETITVDIRDQEALERAMTGVEVVYHLAGSISLSMNSGLEMMAVNIQGTRNVVNACLRCGVRRLVHFSSVEALQQEPLDQALVENRSLVNADHSAARMARIPPYNLSKAQGELEVLAGATRGLDAVIIRPTAMLGPNDFKPSYLGQALIQLANGTIPALVSSGFNWVDVRDVVAGAMCAEQAAPAGASYLLGGHWHTLRDVTELVAKHTNQSAPLFTVPIWLAEAFAPLMLKVAHFSGRQPIYTRVMLNALRGNRQVSSAKAMSELEYTTRPLADTVGDTLTWFQENGYLAEKRP